MGDVLTGVHAAFAIAAALYVAAAADSITADPTTIVGSIGTMTTITDISAMLTKMGITVHLIASGPQKGTGTPGVPVTDERKRPMQAIVNELAAQFKAAVASGRGLDAAAVDAITQLARETIALTEGQYQPIFTLPA